MTAGTPKRNYPNLEGIANPKSPFEVATAQWMKQLTDYTYSNADQIAGMQAPASAAPTPAQASNWWNSAYGCDSFSAAVGATSITLSWTGFRISPTSYVNRKTPYLRVANGSQANAGLAGTTAYWFYPGYDTRQGIIVWGTDPSSVVAGTFAHAAPSGVALMKVSSGGIVPLSPNGFMLTTGGAASQSGLGGGLLHGVPS